MSINLNGVTCAGIFALGFCKNKGITTEGLNISMDLDVNRQTGMITDVIFDVKLPQGFPEKYKEALVRSIELCSVKKHMMEPPNFHINTH
jgi:ribosomal protein S12 methylthiotransferase accessory factor